MYCNKSLLSKTLLMRRKLRSKFLTSTDEMLSNGARALHIFLVP